MRRLLTIVMAAALAWLGDVGPARSFAAIIGTLATLTFLYLFALPAEFPIWPGIVVMLLAGVGGLVWEDASRRDQGLVRQPTGESPLPAWLWIPAVTCISLLAVLAVIRGE